MIERVILEHDGNHDSDDGYDDGYEHEYDDHDDYDYHYDGHYYDSHYVRWYGHEREKWTEFRRRYFEELDSNPKGVAELSAQLGSGTVTLVFSSKEARLNNASALKEYLESC